MIHRIYSPGAAGSRSASPRRTLLAALAFVAASRRAGTARSASACSRRPTSRSSASRSRRRTARASRTPIGRCASSRHELARHPEVKHCFANLGRGNPRVYYNIFPEETNANVAEVFVELHEFDPRRSPQLYEELRAEVRGVPGRADPRGVVPATARRSTRRSRSRSSGPDLVQLRELAAQAEAADRGDAGHARRRQSAAPAAHRPRPAHRHAEGRAARRRADRGGPHGPRRGRGPRASASSARRTATSTTSRSGCRCRAARRSTPSSLIEVASASGQPVPLRQLSAPQFSSAAERDPAARPRARGADQRLPDGRLQHRQGRRARCSSGSRSWNCRRATRCAPAAKRRRARRASAASAPRCWSPCSASSRC